MYGRRVIVVSLMDRIESASSINKLGQVSACSSSNIHFVYDRVCKLYFKLLKGGRVRLLNFVFAGYDRDGSKDLGSSL